MTEQRKNYYEELIDNMMIEGIKGMNDAETASLKAYLRASDTKTKRAKILAVLVENNTDKRKLFSEIQKTEQKYNEIKDYKMSSTKHIQNVIKMLRDYVDFGDVEIKTMGEVMTPITLVEEMLDTLPDNVWTNPNLKWLDPCNGAGIFVSIIVQRLLKGLVNFEPNEDLRYKHIMENMIYVGELQPKNMFLYLYAFDPKDELDMNIYCGSYLDNGFDLHMKEVYGVEKFDIVVMNPPYQELKEGFKKSNPLWDKFVIKAVETSLNTDGYFVAVHPDGWRNLGKGFDKVKNVLKSRQMLYLELHDLRTGVRTFGAQTAYDFYCVRNSENQGNFNTKIKCMDGTTERADISKMKFIPNGMYDAFNKLIAKKGEETVKTIHSFSDYETRKDYVSKEKNGTFKYPCIYTTVKDGSINLLYSSTNVHGHFGIPKVIWSNGGATTPIVDANGDYGMTQFAYAIVDNVQNLEKIKQAMLNPEFTKLMKYADGISSLHRYNYKAITLFRKDFWIDYLG
jgi:hypothetical protein